MDVPRKKDEKYNLANKRRGNSTGDYEDDDEEYENICNSQYQYARSHPCTLTYVAKYNPLSFALLLSLSQFIIIFFVTCDEAWGTSNDAYHDCRF